MKSAMQIKLSIVLAFLPLVSTAGELSRCTAADGKSYSYLTREPCKSPSDIRVPVSATKAITPIKPKIEQTEIIVAGKTPIERTLETQIQDYWKACKIVQATRLKVVSNEHRFVRYSYVLRILSDGARAKPADCPPANSSMLAAMANEDFGKLKAGAEVEVTQEQAMR